MARGAHLDALRAHGLRLATPFGTSELEIPAVGGPGEVSLRSDDVLIIATKTQDVAGVLADWAWQPVAGETVAADALPVVCAQNGVASERFALRRFRQVYAMYVPAPANAALQRLANLAARERRTPGFMTPGQVLASVGAS